MQTFDIYTANAASYWRNYLRDTELSGPPILVDMLHDNLEYVATALSMASSIRTATKRPLIGLTGPAGVMGTAAARPFDMEALEALAAAFGVDQLIDVHAAILSTPQAGEWLDPLREMAGFGDPDQRFAPEHTDLVTGFRDADGFPLGRFVMDTMMRASLTPHLRYGEAYLNWVEYLGRARDWAQGFFAANSFTAFAVGHSDYCPHGFLAEFGVSKGVSTVFWACRERSAFLINSLEPGQTLIGACRSANARAFADHKAHEVAMATYPVGESSALARLIGQGNIMVARANLMGPLFIFPDRILNIREELFGGDPRPIVCLFAHTYSDVPCQDEALYHDHHEWVEATLAVAAESEDFNLLVKVHPQDAAYDVTGLTDSLAAAFDRANIVFCRAPIESEVIARDCALGVTVRGTPGFLLPALGLRMVLAGRSIFSDAGIADTPETREQYLDLLRNVGQLPPLSAAETDNAERFLAFHLLTGSPRHALVPLMRADGRDSPFFAHAAELLRSWVPEDCEFTRDLVRLWSPVTGFQGGPASVRIGGRLPAPEREDGDGDGELVASPPESVEPASTTPKSGVIGWLGRRFAIKPTELVELYKSKP